MPRVAAPTPATSLRETREGKKNTHSGERAPGKAARRVGSRTSTVEGTTARARQDPSKRRRHEPASAGPANLQAGGIDAAAAAAGAEGAAAPRQPSPPRDDHHPPAVGQHCKGVDQVACAVGQRAQQHLQRGGSKQRRGRQQAVNTAGPGARWLPGAGQPAGCCRCALVASSPAKQPPGSQTGARSPRASAPAA